MDNPIGNYWDLRLAEMKNALEENNFEVFLVQNRAAVKAVVLDQILPEVRPQSISWGGSVTFVESGLYEALKSRSDTEILDTYDKSFSPEESYERRRRSLLVDLFITGTNAVTEAGQLVNLDMIGNRVAALTFGPKHVVVIVGRNKIVEDVPAAMYRIKEYAAPVNTMRLEKRTPCVKTGYCEDCKGPDRICNTWTITDKSYPKGRVKIVLVNEELGY